MFSVGLNPKVDFSQLLTLDTESKTTSHIITVDTAGESVLGQTSPGSDKIVLRNKLLEFPRKGCVPHNVATPSLPMVLTGCSAVLQFIGLYMSLPQSLIVGHGE